MARIYTLSSQAVMSASGAQFFDLFGSVPEREAIVDTLPERPCRSKGLRAFCKGSDSALADALLHRF